VSFDDTIEALANGIASYDFNLRAVVAAMIEHLLRWPRRPSYPPGDSPLVELPGFLVQRDSLGPAPKVQPGPGLGNSCHIKRLPPTWAPGDRWAGPR
jgi:hypothetical protein